MRPLRIAVRAALLVLALAAVQASADPEAGSIEGRVSLGIEGLSIRDVAPVVVYLEGVDAPLRFETPTAVATIEQRDARFVPSFLAVVAGQSVRMPNNDLIYHNVFSYSKPNEFDLGLYPAGASKKVELRHAGVVKTYCSIHETMNGTIFVAPSPHHRVVSDSGRFSLADVPPGRYRVVAWSERLPAAESTIRLEGNGRVSVDLVLGDLGTGISPASRPPPPAAPER